MAQMKLIVIILIFLALILGPSLVRASNRVEEIYDAIQHENVGKARINLAADSNAVNYVGEKKYTFLHFAAEHGSPQGIAILKLLLADGAKVDARNHNGVTPLFCAAGSNNSEGAKILIAHGAKVNMRANNGKTALHCAAVNGYWEMTAVLIANGAAINAKDTDGKTPLDFALEEKERTKDPNLIKQYDETIAVLRQSQVMK
jgi:ankyrin repeat protein